MKSFEDVKEYETAVRLLAEQLTRIAGELNMSVHINATRHSDSISTDVCFFGQDAWYKCYDIVTVNRTAPMKRWEEYKEKEEETA